jgi:SAM-dependent methyltransferase
MTFFELLCCPACKGDLDHHPDVAELACPSCRFVFPIVDGIPVLFPCSTKEKMAELFSGHWDSEENAQRFDRIVEGVDPYSKFSHLSEVAALTRYYEPDKMDLVLDAGCGNGRFVQTLPPQTTAVCLDACLNLVRIVKQKNRGHFHVCADLEHLPFRDGVFSTVISTSVLQHLHQQEQAVRELCRVLKDKGNLLLELYNHWNPKTLYKAIRMSPRLRKVLNAPFQLLFRSMSPFKDWGFSYDKYNSWFQVRRWLGRAGMHDLRGQGVGFGYHRYFCEPFYVFALVSKKAPRLLQKYFDLCMVLERRIGHWPPFRYTLERFVIAATKNVPERDGGLIRRVVRRLQRAYRRSSLANLAARAEVRRERSKTEVLVRDNRFHLLEAVDWLKRAQDATADRGVSRGYSVGWKPSFAAYGWQPSYPETTGYIIPTFFDCAAYLAEDELRTRAVEMADWEIAVQMKNGAVMGGTVDRLPTPAVFNTGQVILGWLRAHQETGADRYLQAAVAAGQFLLRTQRDDGCWRGGNSSYANPATTTYNARVGWALILLGQQTGEPAYLEAGKRTIAHTIARQQPNGWFEQNCLNDPTMPLLHTICYAVEGILGAAQALGDEGYLKRARLTANALLECVREDGSLAGRFDCQWQGMVAWSCLTGDAQLAGIWLTLAAVTGERHYSEAARRILQFLKMTQNCVSSDGGLRGGIKGSYPFDGGYGRYEVLNWATKFYVDALLLDER